MTQKQAKQAVDSVADPLMKQIETLTAENTRLGDRVRLLEDAGKELHTSITLHLMQAEDAGEDSAWDALDRLAKAMNAFSTALAADVAEGANP